MQVIIALVTHLELIVFFPEKYYIAAFTHNQIIYVQKRQS